MNECIVFGWSKEEEQVQLKDDVDGHTFAPFCSSSGWCGRPWGSPTPSPPAPRVGKYVGSQWVIDGFEQDDKEVNPKLSWRVGIHLDDIIIEGDNIYGNGVNIAARLESQSPVGEILISDVVNQQINKKIEHKIYSLGKIELKNISSDFEVFSILGDGKNKISKKTSPSVNKKLKFAILPFVNTSKDEDSGFLVDGIVEDLITEFSMMREFDILSRQTSVNFKDENQDIKEFSKKFDLDFLVTGGIRASGKRVRINIELSDANDESIIWSNKYDRVLEDIFDLQDEIVRKISIALLGEIEISSLQRSKRKPTENISSYEYLLRGKENHHKFTKEANQEALQNFDKAIEADSGNAQAYAWKVCTLGQAMFRGFSDRKMEEIFADAKFPARFLASALA